MAETLRQCLRCKEFFLPTLEFFPPYKQRKDGLHSWCRGCVRVYGREKAREYKAKKRVPTKVKRVVEPLRQCLRCKEFFLPTLEFFPSNKRGIDGLHSWCRGCVRVYGREKAREYSKRPEIKARQSDYNRKRNNDPVFKHYKRNYGREYQRERRHTDPKFNRLCLDRTAAYAQTPQGRMTRRTIDIRRAARKKSLPDNFTKEQWQRALDYFNGCCAVCGRQLADLFGEHKSAADHWIPLTLESCPGTVALNIVPLCQGVNGCNQSKGNHNAEDWLTRKFGKRKAKQIMKRIDDYFEWVKHRDAP